MTSKIGQTTRTIDRAFYTLLIDDGRKLFIPELKPFVKALPAGFTGQVIAIAPAGYGWAESWSD